MDAPVNDSDGSMMRVQVPTGLLRAIRKGPFISSLLLDMPY